MMRLLKTFIATTIARSAHGRRFLYQRLPRETAARKHPFDEMFNTETSGFVPSYLLSLGYSARSLINNSVYPYFGCQPNCIRAALRRIESPSDFIFYDIGCGMGRATMIASEFPFERVVGVEISTDLYEIANRNASTIAKCFPDRPPITIFACDATKFTISSQNAVVFLYNPFGSEILKGLIAQLENLVQKGFNVIIIYENPVLFPLIDSSEFFKRRFGAQVACNPEERDYQLDDDEAIAIWASEKVYFSDVEEFDIKIVKPEWRVEIV